MSNVTRAGAADVGCVHEFEKKFVLLLIIFFNFPLEGSVGVSVCSLIELFLLRVCVEDMGGALCVFVYKHPKIEKK